MKNVKWEAGSEKIKIAIDLDDYADDIKAALKNAIIRGLMEIGDSAVEYAMHAVPVDTGRLKNSITYACKGHEGFTHSYKDDKNNKSYSESVGSGAEDNAVYIGSNVEYAAFIELGTSRRSPRPYLKPAATEHNDEYKKIIKDSLENA